MGFAFMEDRNGILCWTGRAARSSLGQAVRRISAGLAFLAAMAASSANALALFSRLRWRPCKLRLLAPQLRSHRRRLGICLCNRIGAKGGTHTPGLTAIHALRMQKDQLQVGHTIHPSDSGRQASERHPCCHKQSVAVDLQANLTAQQSVERQRQLCVSETSWSPPSIEAQLTLAACRRSCDRACGASRFGSKSIQADMAAELALASRE